MKRIILFTFILLQVISLNLFADEWADIKKVAQTIKSINSDFIQEKHLKILNKPLISKGKFYFTAPGSLRWEYVSPVKSILLIHNGKIKSFVNSDKGFVEDARSKSPAMEIVMQEITLWLNGRFNEDPTFNASLESGKQDKIILTPKDKALSGIIQSIELQVSREKGEIISVKISESLDSYTLLIFSNSKQNVRIDENVYRQAK